MDFTLIRSNNATDTAENYRKLSALLPNNQRGGNSQVFVEFNIFICTRLGGLFGYFTIEDLHDRPDFK